MAPCTYPAVPSPAAQLALLVSSATKSRRQVSVVGRQLVLTAYPRSNGDFLYITSHIIRKAFGYQNQAVYAFPDHSILAAEIRDSTTILVLEA